MTSRVVPAIGEVIAASRRANWFNRLDFPAFGGPTIATAIAPRPPTRGGPAMPAPPPPRVARKLRGRPSPAGAAAAPGTPRPKPLTQPPPAGGAGNPSIPRQPPRGQFAGKRTQGRARHGPGQ